MEGRYIIQKIYQIVSNLIELFFGIKIGLTFILIIPLFILGNIDQILSYLIELKFIYFERCRYDND